MSVEHFALGVLTMLLIAQQAYWSKVVYQLTNRLMSRNYFEFAHAEKIKKQNPASREPLEDQMVIDPEAERQAQEMNTLFNIA